MNAIVTLPVSSVEPMSEMPIDVDRGASAPRSAIAAVLGGGDEGVVRYPFAGATETVVIVPGLGMAAKRYDGLARRLNELGVAAAVLATNPTRDVRRADLVERDYGLEDLGRAAADAVERIHRKDRTSVLLLGHSLGGRIAAIAAAQRPAGLTGLITVATGTRHWRTGGIRLGRFLTDVVALPVITRLAGYFPGHRVGFGGRQPARLMSEFSAMARTGSLQVCRGGRPRPYSLDAVSVPVLVAGYENDPVQPIPTLEQWGRHFAEDATRILDAPAAEGSVHNAITRPGAGDVEGLLSWWRTQVRGVEPSRGFERADRFELVERIGLAECYETGADLEDFADLVEPADLGRDPAYA